MYKAIYNESNIEVSPMNARQIVMESTNADGKVTFTYQKLHTGEHPMYEMEYNADDMEYFCYVSAETGEILGLMSQPKAA